MQFCAFLYVHQNTLPVNLIVSMLISLSHNRVRPNHWLWNTCFQTMSPCTAEFCVYLETPIKYLHARFCTVLMQLNSICPHILVAYIADCNPLDVCLKQRFCIFSNSILKHGPMKLKAECLLTGSLSKVIVYIEFIVFVLCYIQDNARKYSWKYVCFIFGNVCRHLYWLGMHGWSWQSW